MIFYQRHVLHIMRFNFREKGYYEVSVKCKNKNTRVVLDNNGY